MIPFCKLVLRADPRNFPGFLPSRREMLEQGLLTICPLRSRARDLAGKIHGSTVPMTKPSGTNSICLLRCTVAGPSLYKPRRTIRPETGAEVDTSVNALLVGVVGLLLLLATFVGMISYSSMSRPAPVEEAERPTIRNSVDIGVQPVEGTTTSP